MAVVKVKNQEFQRAAGQWLQKAQEGNIVLIVSKQKPTLKLQPVIPPKQRYNWKEHFEWLKTQPPCEENPVDQLRRLENR